MISITQATTLQALCGYAGCLRFALGYTLLGVVQLIMFVCLCIILVITAYKRRKHLVIQDVQDVQPHRRLGFVMIPIREIDVLQACMTKPLDEPEARNLGTLCKECAFTLFGCFGLAFIIAIAGVIIGTPAWWIIDIFRTALGYVHYADGTRLI